VLQISKEVAYVLGGGIALVILERVFAFIRWLWKTTRAGNPTNLSDRELMERILTKVDGVCDNVGQVQVEMGVVKTELSYFARNQKKQWKKLDDAAAKLSDVSETIGKQILKCDKRFSLLERAVTPRTKREK